MAAPPKPHALNVVGDFYVEDGCCTICGVPEVEAPELFGPEPPWGQGTDHCYVRKQPSNADELTKMLRTIECAELACIRYRGRDEAIVNQLRDRDLLDQVDYRD